MNTKEIIISLIVLMVLLMGFFFLIKLAKNRARTNEAAQEVDSGAVPTTENLKPAQELNPEVTPDLPFQNTDTAQDETQDTGFESKRTQQAKKLNKPAFTLKAGVDYQAVIKTSMGDIKVDLFEEDTPNTVNNFVYLANTAFYDGLLFHRIIPDFMIQGGDPLGNGTGDPGYKFDDEILSRFHFDKGTLAMANSGKNTNGSQFFIVVKDEAPWLDGDYTKFGQVIEGQDIADKISMVKTGPNDRPLENVYIKTVLILEN